MANIIARAHIGARDLYNGIPDLLGAVVNSVAWGDESESETTLIMVTKNGKEYSVTIKQA